MSQVTFKCGWCGSKDQTADIIHNSLRQVEVFSVKQMQPYIVVLCRRCKRATSLFWTFSYDLPPHLKRFSLSYEPRIDPTVFNYDGDITEAFGQRSRQVPEFVRQISSEIPKSVREACLDAQEARSPRSKCQSFRSAVEFALREAKLTVKSGQTLGSILKDASKTFAISEPLIELCDQVKAFGNWGLHWSEKEIVESDAEVAESITYTVLDYLFVLPKKVEQAKARTGEAIKVHKASFEDSRGAQ